MHPSPLLLLCSTLAAVHASALKKHAAPLPRATAPKPQKPIYNPCNINEVLQTGCKGPKDCLYPTPGNCATFLQCVPQDLKGNALPTEMPCPGGLEWNDNKKLCDYPQFSTCPTKEKRDGGGMTEKRDDLEVRQDAADDKTGKHGKKHEGKKGGP